MLPLAAGEVRANTRQKNGAFKKFEDLQEARAFARGAPVCVRYNSRNRAVGKSIYGHRRGGEHTKGSQPLATRLVNATASLATNPDGDPPRFGQAYTLGAPYVSDHGGAVRQRRAG